MPSGQPRKDPYRVKRDVKRDNLTIVRKLNLPQGATINSQRQQASVVGGSINDPYVLMPSNGLLTITVISVAYSFEDTPIVIRNPFIQPNTPVTILNTNSNGGTATNALIQSGVQRFAGGVRIDAGGDILVGGSFAVQVGTTNDSRSNGYSQ